jgi:hypothetical protein
MVEMTTSICLLIIKRQRRLESAPADFGVEELGTDTCEMAVGVLNTRAEVGKPELLYAGVSGEGGGLGKGHVAPFAGTLKIGVFEHGFTDEQIAL